MENQVSASLPKKTTTKPSAKQIIHCSVSIILLASLCSLECPLQSLKSYPYKRPSTHPNFSGKPSKIFLAHRNYPFLRIHGRATIFFLDSSYFMVLLASVFGIFIFFLHEYWFLPSFSFLPSSSSPKPAVCVSQNYLKSISFSLPIRVNLWFKPP